MSGITYAPFDIETTDLYPIKSEVVSFCFGGFSAIQRTKDSEFFVLTELLQYANQLNKPTTTILTFNGGTWYKQGLDFPYMRTRFMKHGLPWPFKGFNHIDMFPIIQKMFIMDFMDFKTLKDLNVDELKKMIKHFGSTPGKNKDEHVSIIKEFVTEDDINKYLIEHVEKKVKPHYGLKDSCLHLLGIEDFGIDGKKVPGMFQTWKDTGDDSIIEEILAYNKDDCEKTLALFNEVQKYVSVRGMSGELL